MRRGTWESLKEEGGQGKIIVSEKLPTQPAHLSQPYTNEMTDVTAKWLVHLTMVFVSEIGFHDVDMVGLKLAL